MPDRHARCAAAATCVSVLLPLPLEGAYDYAVGDCPPLAPGDFVRVPLGSRALDGVVWSGGSGDVAPEKLKSVLERRPAPPLKDELRRFIDWVAHYTLAPPGAVLRMAMSVPAALEPPRGRAALSLAEKGRAALASGGDSLSAPRRRALAVLADGPPFSAAELARQAACGIGVVRALVTAGMIDPISLPPLAPPQPDWRHPGPTLSTAQEEAASELVAAVAKGGYGVTLLDGVTGSGKTEVYFAAIAAALERGRQVLVLLPEIALSQQWLARFADRFGAAPV